jgi:hypothetical protein
LQDKKWVTIRYDRTLAILKADAEEFGYINLDIFNATPINSVASTPRSFVIPPRRTGAGGADSNDLRAPNSFYSDCIIGRPPLLFTL